MMRLPLVAVCVLAALVLVACSDSDGSPEDAPPTEASPYTIEVVEPQGGADVTPEFALSVEVTGVELDLGPNEELVPGAAHWHATVDGEALPFAFGEPSWRMGPLPPGKHAIEVTLYLNDADSVAVASDTIDVNVSE
jgi:hypothetical protein